MNSHQSRQPETPPQAPASRTGLRLTLPMYLTWIRLLAIPILIALFYLPAPASSVVAAIVFAAAAATDWFDGYLARRLNLTSAFGAFLDPVADKVLVAVVLVLLLQADPQALLALAIIVIIGREIAISALREWMAALGERTSVAVSNVAKFKTASQMLAIFLMLWRRPVYGLDVYLVGFALLLLAAVLTIWTMVMYLRAAWPFLVDERPPKP